MDSVVRLVQGAAVAVVRRGRHSAIARQKFGRDFIGFLVLSGQLMVIPLVGLSMVMLKMPMVASVGLASCEFGMPSRSQSDPIPASKKPVASSPTSAVKLLWPTEPTIYKVQGKLVSPKKGVR